MLIQEMLNKLSEPIPNEFISQKTLKGNRIDFIAWYDVCELLDQRLGAGNWSWDVVKMEHLPNVNKKQEMDNKLALVGKLSIYGKDRTLEFSATGIEDMNCSSYGDPTSNAEAMSLRRAAAKAGLARSLWRKGGPAPGKRKQSEGGTWQTMGRKHYLQKGLSASIVNHHLNSARDKDDFKQRCEKELNVLNSSK